MKLTKGYSTKIKNIVMSNVPLFDRGYVIDRDEMVEKVRTMTDYKEPFTVVHVRNEGKLNSKTTSYTKGSLQVEFALKECTDNGMLEFLGKRRWRVM